jgi:cobalt-zinc-cadmium efflux system membrane fusion protein
MRNLRLLLSLIVLFISGILTVAAYLTRDLLLARLGLAGSPAAETTVPAAAGEPKMLKLGPQARENLNLKSQPLTPQNYWRTLQVPGAIVDRPGYSDRGLTAPAVSVVVKVHAFPGDTVKPDDRLFTLRLVSEYLQNSQSELFKTTREAQLVQQEKDRLMPLAKSGGVSEAKIIELDQQLKRLEAARLSYRQDLLSRGLSPTQLDRIAEGKFASEIEVVAPPPAPEHPRLVNAEETSTPANGEGPAYEVQELKVELGKQVLAGETLCVLANHRVLYIEGHGFRSDAAVLEQAAQNDWPVQVEFVEDEPDRWPSLTQTFHIRHLANTVDAETHTFGFFLPLTNQSRSYQKEGKTFLVWRFRPGQRVRLHVPVEEFKDVLVLPAGAVGREGPEAYVFLQNGDLFERVPVRVLYEDRRNVVLAKGSFDLQRYVAQGAGASLNRILKAQNSGSGLPPGAHFHADGSLHIPGK